jgi:CubicO group peptidase (beta-lactamase class C family)
MTTWRSTCRSTRIRRHQQVQRGGRQLRNAPAKRPITIRHLLTHTSGIGYGFASQTVATLHAEDRQDRSWIIPLLFDPGESWAYGASTRVLGKVVEAISGQKIDAFLESRILKPLGMQDTAYLVPQSKYSRVRRRESARRRRQVHRAAGAGDDSRAGAGRWRPLLHCRRLRIVPADAAQRRQARRDAILNEKTVKTMFENHTGSVVVQPQQSTNLSLSRTSRGRGRGQVGARVPAGKNKQPNMRSPGSGTWAGIFNTHFFIDPSREIGVVVMMQTLPSMTRHR